jgi:NADH-quinone oxidoreductase subunit A
MSLASDASLGIAAYLALFFLVGVMFLFVNLLVGYLLRPADPHEEKVEIYECGEPTIGSSFVQFDLRFYVVALLFIIFDVEIAFFFPWATVFGKSANLADERLAVVRSVSGELELTPAAHAAMQELSISNPGVPAEVPGYLAKGYAERFGSSPPTSEASASYVIRRGFWGLALLATLDILAFFGVLVIGFLYVWKRGDLDWVRAVSQERGLRRNEATQSQRLRVRREAGSALGV